MKKRILILAALSFAITQGSYAMDRQRRQEPREGSPEAGIEMIFESACLIAEYSLKGFLGCFCQRNLETVEVKKHIEEALKAQKDFDKTAKKLVSCINSLANKRKDDRSEYEACYA